MRTRIAVGTIVVALWLATLLTSDVPPLWATLVWAAGGATFYFWGRRDVVKEQNARIAHFDSILHRDAADVFHIEAQAFVGLGEIEDDVDSFAFEVDGNRLVFVLLRLVETTRPQFPSLDFELVHYLDSADSVVVRRLTRSGPQTSPIRVITTDHAAYHDFDHLEVVAGNLSTIETVLAQRAIPQPFSRP